MSSVFPELIESESQLDELLTQPDEALIRSITQLQSPLVIVGAGGKMGPSLAVLAKRAARVAGHDLEVVAASRFRNADSRRNFENAGVVTQSVDVFDRSQLAELPDSANVVYLVGMKFGTATDPVPTWVTNTLGPVLTAERYAGSNIVALSTGNVYPNVARSTGGCKETHELTPLGEYANAAVARERLFEYYSRDYKTKCPTVLLRLNYAHDLRYGVLSDIANKVYQGEPIDQSVGYFNAIWQGDANAIILRSFDLCTCPATKLNLTSNEIYSVRDVATEFARRFNQQVSFVGTEQDTALLSNASEMISEFGDLNVSLDLMMRWIAHWTIIGGKSLHKPTHFETRDGKY